MNTSPQHIYILFSLILALNAQSMGCVQDVAANETKTNVSKKQSKDKAVAVELLEVLDARPYDPSAAALLLADNYTDHDRSPTTPAELSDAQGIMATYEALANAFSDGTHKLIFVESMVDGRVSMRWRFTGTHDGPLFGIPATGKRVDIDGLEVLEIQDGKIKNQWHIQEIAALFEQIGAAQ